ncbi:MAG: 16S rRNA (guanine(527)-N(7))-methyltransferase RsmG [Cyclobacteriaceae bacterium]
MDNPELVFKYFPELSDNQADLINKLGPLYISWNQRINLISRKDIESLYGRHILHSMAIARFIQFKAGSKVLDVGTGGGFPGIPLAICFPDVEFTLLDSIGKKVKVVEDIRQELNLKNVKTLCERVENLTEKYDFITARAVTKITPFYTWTKSKILSSFTNEMPNGILYLKGGDLTEELSTLKVPYKLIELKDYFKESFFETKKLIYIPFVK